MSRKRRSLRALLTRPTGAVFVSNLRTSIDSRRTHVSNTINASSGAGYCVLTKTRSVVAAKDSTIVELRSQLLGLTVPL